MANFGMARRQRESSCTLLRSAFYKWFAVDSQSHAGPVAGDEVAFYGEKLQLTVVIWPSLALKPG